MDCAQPGARGSTNRNIEFGETTSQFSDGWIVPADDPTLSAQRYTSLDETAFNEFGATYSADSLTVTIDPGEAFVDGWLARDEPTDIPLDADTAGQTVIIGWDPDAIYDDQQHAVRDEGDRVIVNRESALTEPFPSLPIWSVDTDCVGVTSASDLRSIGPTMAATNTTYESQGTGSIDAISSKAVTHDKINIPTILVEHPDRLPIAELRDGESIEIPVTVPANATLEIYRWGAFTVSTHSVPSRLTVELLDGSDTVQASANTMDDRDPASPVVPSENMSGSASSFQALSEERDGVTD
jgi:hypothetical protein